jgi:NitT/TauT family transport system substrate-binding protein
VAALLNAGQAALAVLPQPYVTTVMKNNDNLRIALGPGAEWKRLDPHSARSPARIVASGHEKTPSGEAS